MTIGVLAEKGNDKRVALTPENISALLNLKVSTVLVEKGAGKSSFYNDSQYEAQGAVISGREDVLQRSDLILTVGLQDDIPAGKVIVGGLNPLMHLAETQKMASAGITSFSLDVIPRTTRAQAMDILSSMATVAGYKAVLTAASTLPKFFPMFMTAAGSITPAKVLVLGAGVAGLQAIATAKRLGAVVEASDVRSAAREEVLSLGAKFVDVEGAVEDKGAGGYAVEQSEEFKKRQQEAVQEHASKSDVVICTAQIPGRKAPILLKKETIERMKPGSVIMDLASSTGGNCELTKDNETVIHNGVYIIGNSNLQATIPADASKMFGKNMVNFLKLIIKEGELNLNYEDDLVAGTCVTKDGQVVHERVKKLIS